MLVPKLNFMSYNLKQQGEEADVDFKTKGNH